MRAYRLIVDGKKIGRIKDGQTKTFPVEPGEHKLFLKIDCCSSTTLSFSLPANHSARFVCGSNLWGLEIFLIPFYILFARKNYLWLKPFGI
jgi:hypothetical protein